MPRVVYIYPPFEARLVTVVCTGIRQNQFLFKTRHSLLISKLAQHINTQTQTYSKLVLVLILISKSIRTNFYNFPVVQSQIFSSVMIETGDAVICCFGDDQSPMRQCGGTSGRKFWP